MLFCFGDLGLCVNQFEVGVSSSRVEEGGCVAHHKAMKHCEGRVKSTGGRVEVGASGGFGAVGHSSLLFCGYWSGNING